MTELYRYIHKIEPVYSRLIVPLAISDGVYKTAKYKLVKILKSYIQGCDSGLYRLDGRSVSRIKTITIIENKRMEVE